MAPCLIKHAAAANIPVDGSHTPYSIDIDCFFHPVQKHQTRRTPGLPAGNRASCCRQVPQWVSHLRLVHSAGNLQGSVRSVFAPETPA
jgi:hypothetical protein